MPEYNYDQELRQVTSKLKSPCFIELLLSKTASRQVTGKLKFPCFIELLPSKAVSRQVTSKLNHPQIGIYFMYLGAVAGSYGRINFFATASLIILETIPCDEGAIPNLSLKELFVK